MVSVIKLTNKHSCLSDLKLNFTENTLKICQYSKFTVHREEIINTFNNPLFDFIAVSETCLKPNLPSTPNILNDTSY